MNKKIIMILMFLLLIPSAISVADSTIEKIIVPVSIDFKGEREFTITIEGQSKDVSWTNGTTHDDISYDVNVFRNFTWADKCPEDAAAWQNLTSRMAAIVETNNQLIKLGNETNLVANEYADLKEGLGGMSVKLDQCKNDLAIAGDKANQLVSCTSSRDSYQGQLTACKEELESSDSNPVIMIGIGAAAVWFLMKKKENKPQEYDEFGGIPPHPQ